MILFFKQKWLIDCPPTWQNFVNYTRDLDNSDSHFRSECKRYGIISLEDDSTIYFESEESRTNFLLAFSGDEQ